MSDAVPISVGGSGMQRSLAGGHAWALAHWAIGVRHLGYPVTFLDRRENDPVQPPLQALVTDGGANYVSIDDEMHTEDVAGPGVAGALLNIMGFVPTELRGGAEALRVFVDIDPWLSADVA